MLWEVVGSVDMRGWCESYIKRTSDPHALAHVNYSQLPTRYRENAAEGTISIRSVGKTWIDGHHSNSAANIAVHDGLVRAEKPSTLAECGWHSHKMATWCLIAYTAAWYQAKLLLECANTFKGRMSKASKDGNANGALCTCEP